MKKYGSVQVLGDFLRPDPDGLFRPGAEVEWLRQSLQPILDGLGLAAAAGSGDDAEPFRQTKFYALALADPTEAGWHEVVAAGDIGAPARAYLESHVARADFVLGLHLSNFLKEILQSLGVPYLNLRPLDLPFCADLLFWGEWQPAGLGEALRSFAVPVADLRTLARVHGGRQGRPAVHGTSVLLCNDAADPMLYEWGIPAGYDAHVAELQSLAPRRRSVAIASARTPGSEQSLRLLTRRFPDAEIRYGDIAAAIDDPAVGLVVCLSPATALRSELAGKETVCLTLAETRVVDAVADDPLQGLLPAPRVLSSEFWAALAGLSGPGSPPAPPPGLFRESRAAALAAPPDAAEP